MLQLNMKKIIKYTIIIGSVFAIGYGIYNLKTKQKENIKITK